MLKESELVGVVIYRQVRPFTEKQIELVKNFATQAVIAIENARLLNDLNKLNQQLEQRVTDQVSEIERMGKLRRFLPAQVADLIVASGAEKQLEAIAERLLHCSAICAALPASLRALSGRRDGTIARIPCGHWRSQTSMAARLNAMLATG
jgi:hypothetical protein